MLLLAAVEPQVVLETALDLVLQETQAVQQVQPQALQGLAARVIQAARVNPPLANWHSLAEIRAAVAVTLDAPVAQALPIPQAQLTRQAQAVRVTQAVKVNPPLANWHSPAEIRAILAVLVARVLQIPQARQVLAAPEAMVHLGPQAQATPEARVDQAL